MITFLFYIINQVLHPNKTKFFGKLKLIKPEVNYFKSLRSPAQILANFSQLSQIKIHFCILNYIPCLFRNKSRLGKLKWPLQFRYGCYLNVFADKRIMKYLTTDLNKSLQVHAYYTCVFQGLRCGQNEGHPSQT